MKHLIYSILIVVWMVQLQCMELESKRKSVDPKQAASAIKYYVPVPRDKYWATGGLGKKVGTGQEDPKNSRNISFVDPVTNKIKSVIKAYLIECEGPARELSMQEYVALILALKPELKGYGQIMKDEKAHEPSK